MENIKPLNSNQLTEIMDKYSPFLKEVKKRLTKTIYVFIIATFAGFIFNEQILKFLVNFLSLQGVNIVFTSPFQFINLAIYSGLVTGLVVVFPFLIHQLLHFLKPALNKKEYKIIVNFIPISIVLFLIGFIFGAIIMKWQIEIFLAKSVSIGIGNILDISGLLTTVFLTAAIMGIGFQFPVLIFILMKVGIIKHQQLSKKRPWVYLGSFIFALLLPPDSILADIILSLPLIILFELTLIMNRIVNKDHFKTHPSTAS